ncbi:hypothetical protein [Burkholderia sp. FERM BP-3421]|uniref:hypothetical protein n=1 Tax=Burkholderia sp. FERM BP-3421 TaxID=1494466 RepID=UPI00235E631D|nr:hypothetical protein [Burkholderia sp. FERM BP-3421]
MAGLAFGALDDLMVSTKLLLAGQGAPAGNVMRRVIEGVAVGAQCAPDTPLILQPAGTKRRLITDCYREPLRVVLLRAARQADLERPDGTCPGGG